MLSDEISYKHIQRAKEKNKINIQIYLGQGKVKKKK
jgi:hypothetical protein